MALRQLLCVCVLCGWLSAAALDPDWENYKSRYHRHYLTQSEEGMRHSLFNVSKQRVIRKNAQLDTPVFGITKFSDRTKDEFSVLLGRKHTPAIAAAVREAAAWVPATNADNASLPRTVDWTLDVRTVVSPVKDQGQCGSCWAFSVAETVESQMVLAGLPPTEYSPQQLAAYTPDTTGCGGGDPLPAYNYINNFYGNNPLRGLTTSGFCPYTQSMHVACTEKACTNACGGSSDWGTYADNFPFARVSSFSWGTVPCVSGACDTQDLQALKATVAGNGPVSICLNAATWDDYDGGILSSLACGSMATDAIDHCVQLVGYHDAGVPEESYWLVRNSWNTDWGENGYIRLQLGNNTCGLANEATVPIINVTGLRR